MTYLDETRGIKLGMRWICIEEQWEAMGRCVSEIITLCIRKVKNNVFWLISSKSTCKLHVFVLK